MKKELLNGLTQEQIKKASACKNNSELLALAKEEGIELSDEQLQAVAGGGCTIISIPKCPNCGSVWILQVGGKWKCLSCDEKFRKPK